MNIGFFGVGNMGGPMAANLVKAGHSVRAFDLSEAAVAKLVGEGAVAASSAADAVSGAEAVVTMLPAGKHVRAVYEGEIFGAAAAGTLFMDCSTIDVDSARHVGGLAKEKGFRFVDAPVSGGVAAATAGTLTFMVGGSEEDFAVAEPFLQSMGKAVIRGGDLGAGQAVKICNNMLLAITMIGTCEAFTLAEKLGLDPQNFFDIASKASGQSWSMTSYCPVPGPVPTSPANRDYTPGFATALMLKDMGLALQAAKDAGADVSVAEKAAAIYQDYADAGEAGKDFSGIINLIRDRADKA